MIDFKTSDVKVFFAPPGAGKTYSLMDEMVDFLSVYRPDEIAFVTFTRKGVANGIERALKANRNLREEDLIHFKTLHAMCFREAELKHKNIIERADIERFNRLLGFNVHLSESFENTTEDDKLLQRYDAIRAGSKKGIYIERAVDEERFTRLVKAYESFKQQNDLVDFYDCLIRFRDRGLPVSVKAALVDEAQDLTPLQWDVCNIAFSECEKIRIAGDDYQCQPPGSPVLTSNGYIPIEEINDDSNLIVYDRVSSAFYGRNKRLYKAKKSEHKFRGNLVTIRTDIYNDDISFTPNHRMLVKWLNRDTNLRCVYLMRRGDDFRVGQCQVFNAQGATHLSYRMRQEGADALWVLEVSRDAVSILVAEQVISHRYGIPQMCFTFRRDVADPVFEILDTKSSAERCLADKFLDINLPLLTDSRIRSQSGGTRIFECEAVNLIPEIMAFPAIDETYRRVRWVRFRKERTPYTGKVYGLSVEKYHNYITGGIATHNSLFSYCGASPETLIDLSKKYETVKLERSYRLPRAIYNFTKGITEMIQDKVDKDFVPIKDDEGFVKEINDRAMMCRVVKEDLERNGYQKDRWYMLFRNNCFIADIAEHLEQLEIPYHTAKGFCIAAKDLAKVRRYMNYRKDGYGSKDALKSFMQAYNIKDINADFTESDLIPGENRYMVRDYIAKFGLDRLEEMAKGNPFLLVSTTHRVKGGEAEFSVVFLECTRLVSENISMNLDEELRVLYVACTRAKNGLYLVPSTGKYGLDNVVEMVKEMVV